MDLRDSPVALFLPDFPRGGVEVVTARLASGLAHLRPVQLVLASDVPDEAEIPSTVAVVRFGAKRTLAALPPLVGYLRHAQPAGLF
jgi:hypothetical protein